MSQFQDQIRKASRFDPRNIGVGGPIFIVQTTLLPNNNFRKGFDNINWSKNGKRTNQTNTKSKNMP